MQCKFNSAMKRGYLALQGLHCCQSLRLLDSMPRTIKQGMEHPVSRTLHGRPCLALDEATSFGPPAHHMNLRPIDEQRVCPKHIITKSIPLPLTDPHLREPLVGVGLPIERQRVLRDVVMQEEVQFPVGFGEVVECRLEGLPARVCAREKQSSRRLQSGTLL